MDYSPGLEYHLLYHALSAEDTLLEEETRREQEEAREDVYKRQALWSMCLVFKLSGPMA